MKGLLINLILSVVDSFLILDLCGSFAVSPLFYPMILSSVFAQNLLVRKTDQEKGYNFVVIAILTQLSLTKGMAGSSSKHKVEYLTGSSLQSRHMCSNATMIQDVNEYHM